MLLKDAAGVNGRIRRGQFWGIGDFKTVQRVRVHDLILYLLLFVAMLEAAIADGWRIAALAVNAGINDHLPSGSGALGIPVFKNTDRGAC